MAVSYTHLHDREGRRESVIRRLRHIHIDVYKRQAIEAKKAGASVVVLEKMATVGGNPIINGGILTATGCPQQKKHGIKDSPELLAHDMLVAGLYLNLSLIHI